MASLKLFPHLRDKHTEVLNKSYRQIQSGASCKIRFFREQSARGSWHGGLKFRHHSCDQFVAIQSGTGFKTGSVLAYVRLITRRLTFFFFFWLKTSSRRELPCSRIYPRLALRLRTACLPLLSGSSAQHLLRASCPCSNYGCGSALSFLQ